MTEYARVDLPTGVQTRSEIATLASGVQVQVCRASVEHVGRPSIRVVLLLDTLGRDLATLDDLRYLSELTPPDGILAGLLTARSGEAVVITLPEGDGAAEDVALAAAVCAASWGWDESECIDVQVNGRWWRITPSLRDGAWIARTGR